MLDLSGAPERREQAARARSAAYVFMSAAIERCVKDVLVAVLREINAQGVPFKDIRTSLFALLSSGHIDFIRASGKSRTLERHTRAVAMFSQVVDAGNCAFSLEVLPVDGRTFRATHLQAIWTVFGFNGVPVPNPTHALALQDLATGRNEVAHGTVDPVTFGRGKATADVAKLIDRIEDVVLHFVSTADNYTSGAHYLR